MGRFIGWKVGKYEGGKVGISINLILNPNLTLNKKWVVLGGSDNPVALLERLVKEPRKARKGC